MKNYYPVGSYLYWHGDIRFKANYIIYPIDPEGGILNTQVEIDGVEAVAYHHLPDKDGFCLYVSFTDINLSEAVSSLELLFLEDKSYLEKLEKEILNDL